MKKILRVAVNPLSDIEISTPRICDFAIDCAPKLLEDFPAESAAIDAARAAVESDRSNIQQLAAGRSTDTSVLDNMLVRIAETMRKSQARISVDLGEDSKEYAALYPNGLRTYSQLSKTNAPAQLLTVKQTIAATGDRLHEPTRRELLGFHDEWERLRKNQQTSEGGLEAERDERDENRLKLEDALFEALLQVARANKRNPDALKRYFDHTLLDAPRHASLERPAATT
ncbi:MAG: hypothetical protein EOO15_14230 [Chitinophagaceae bacterium]|nr:MAG: hypothetical protein EOO15_14230 [Chitinophagaceae bacterium]